MVSGPLPATMASPSLARFLEAFTSRSRTSPHCVQTYVRSDRASLAFTAPHSEQVSVDQDQPTDTGRRGPGVPFPEPTIRGDRVHPIRDSHSFKYTITIYRLLRSNS